MQPSPWHPPTHEHCNMSALQRRRRKKKEYLFVFLKMYLMPPVCLTYTTSLLSLFPNVRRDEKQNAFVRTKKKKKKGGGSAGGITHVWGLIFRSLYPSEKLLNTACTAQAKAGSRFAGTYFPLSPHGWLNRGSALKCLWPLEERGRGLIRLFCEIGHTTSIGTVTAHLLTAATVWCPRC